MPLLPTLMGAVVNEVISQVSQATGRSIPGGSIAGALASGYLEGRYRAMLELAIEELKAARVDAIEASSRDDAIGITLRLLRAVRDGTARLNLRLLAKAVAGQARRGDLVADEFHLHAERLASLSRDEIVVIASLYRQTVAADEHSAGMPNEAPLDPWASTQSELDRDFFRSKGHTAAIAAQAQRSGLISVVGVVGNDSPLIYGITPAMRDLAQLVDFQDALRREGVEI